MIASRWERPEPTAAKPVLIVGMAKSLNNPEFEGPSFERLAKYCGASLRELHRTFDFVNLVDGHPGRDDANKYDRAPDAREWKRVGQRASLLYADLMERPRKQVIGLGGFVRDALNYWWPSATGSGNSRSDWFTSSVGPSGALVYWSPHPSGANMWWNDSDHLAAGETFWQGTLGFATAAYPLPPKQVSLGHRSTWLRHVLRQASSAEVECIDWPFITPRGRPVALYQGDAIPAAQVALRVAGHPRQGEEQQALHSCDRGEHCVNPAHLKWGTELENRLDQVERSRGSIGKVGLEQAQDIVKRFDKFVAELAAEYEVSQAAIKSIAMGKSWNPEKWRDDRLRRQLREQETK